MDNKRRRNRVKAVLPVRVLFSDSSGNQQCELAHTLDITNTGARLGAVRRPLKVGARLILQYKQHKAEFRVIWIVRLQHLKEHQVGLEALVPKDLWGLAAESGIQLGIASAEGSSAQAGA